MTKPVKQLVEEVRCLREALRAREQELAAARAAEPHWEQPEPRYVQCYAPYAAGAAAPEPTVRPAEAEAVATVRRCAADEARGGALAALHAAAGSAARAETAAAAAAALQRQGQERRGAAEAEEAAARARLLADAAQALGEARQRRLAEQKRRAREQRRREAEEGLARRQQEAEAEERRRAEQAAAEADARARAAAAAAEAERRKAEAPRAPDDRVLPVCPSAEGVTGMTAEEGVALLGRQSAVRNVVVIAHVDAGKTTLTDALLGKAGIIYAAKAGRACHMDSGVEQERGITIKAAAVSLAYRTPAAEGGECVINLIDSPGHVDFNAEVTSAMRVSDGALVVIDAVEGVQVQTELVLRQALGERVVPTLVLNKTDRLLLQLRLPPEEAYQRLLASAEAVAALTAEGTDPAAAAACREELGRGPAPRAEEGTVCFASGLQGWGFTLATFARLYERKTGVPAAKIQHRLWGDHYWNAETRKWSAKSVASDGRSLPRGFVHFILRPLCALHAACSKGDWEGLTQEVERLWAGSGAGLLAAEERVPGDAAFGLVLRRLLPAADALVELAAGRLPSPLQAQRYRAEVLCEAPADGELDLRDAVRRCDPDGPLVVYVTKLVPIDRQWGFYSFGRVFSGRACAGAKVHVLGHGGARVQSAALLMARKELRVQEVPAGSLAALVGIDGAVTKTATVVDPALAGARPLKGIKHAVAPVVRSAVECVCPAELPQLAKALRWLQRSDPLVQCETDGGQVVVAGAGELHLELCLRSLAERMQGPPGAPPGQSGGLRPSQPAVAYRETVTGAGPSCLAKSPAKHNRVWARAGPLPEGLPEALERGELPVGHSEADCAARTKALVDRWGWSREEARAVWAVCGSNILVDASKAVPYLGEVKGHIVSSFEELCSSGPLCGEPLRGVCLYITDAKLHGDSHHRGPAELLPASSRAFKAALLRPESAPALLEPVFRCSVETVAAAAGAVRSEVPRRRGLLFDEQHTANGSVRLEAHVPVATSFGLADALRAATGGRAFPSCSFDHWRRLPGDPLQLCRPAGGKGAAKNPAKRPAAEPAPGGDLCCGAVAACRARKGMRPEVPPAAEFEDKL